MVHSGDNPLYRVIKYSHLYCTDCAVEASNPVSIQPDFSSRVGFWNFYISQVRGRVLNS